MVTSVMILVFRVGGQLVSICTYVGVGRVYITRSMIRNIESRLIYVDQCHSAMRLPFEVINW